MSSQTTPATTSDSKPDFNSTISIMLFEGGALIRALEGNKQAQALADKIEQADRDAFAAGTVEFDVALDPIEVGIALQAVSESQSLLAQTLEQKLKDALSAKLQALDISYGGSSQSAQPSLGDSGEPQPSMDDGSSDAGSQDDQDAL